MFLVYTPSVLVALGLLPQFGRLGQTVTEPVHQKMETADQRNGVVDGMQ